MGTHDTRPESPGESTQGGIRDTGKRVARAEVIARLEAWAERGKALRLHCDLFQSLTGATLDGPIFAAMFEVWDAYTDATAELVGDRLEWLRWYDEACKFGRRLQIAISPRGAKVRVRTVKQLARVIAWDRA